MAKSRMQNRLLRSKADPNTLARDAFIKLVYGPQHIFSVDRTGNETSVAAMTLDDLKAYYAANFSPSVASFHVAGDISQAKVMASLKNLDKKWKSKEVVFPEYPLVDGPKASKVYFVDVPGAKQSVISIGCLSLSRNDPDYYAATVMNYKLGGSFNSDVNLVLREEKGFTYGARTSISGSYIRGTFVASSSVRSSATFESVQIFMNLMEAYRNGISEEDLLFTKNSLNKSKAREFETLGAKLGMLQNISMYNLPKDYVRQQEKVVADMTLEEHKALAQKYIDPAKMYYVIAGDAATQKEALGKLGFGEAEMAK